MDKFETLTAVAAPIMNANVDTDIIVPMGRMVTAERKDMHSFAFEPWRFQEDGAENPEFILNREGYREAEILITGPNFGCGSSREGAVWALRGLGIRCLIGSSFGNIFFNNCFQNGILSIQLPADVVDRMAARVLASTNAAVVKVDLENCLIIPASGEPVRFDVDPNRRTQLLQGLDDVGLTLQHVDEIETFRMRDREKRPWIYG